MSLVLTGRIEPVKLRDVWAHEAHHLTTWLEANLDFLGETLGISLHVIDREKRAGDFIIDLVAEDDEGRLVVIENQLERSDHDHLGKLITYVSMIDAKTAVWVVAEPRPEHLKAIQWLNEAGDVRFYLIKLQAIRIGESLLAPLFTLFAGPNETSLTTGQIKRDQQNVNDKYGAFWKAFVDAGRTRDPLFNFIVPRHRGEIYSNPGYPRVGFMLKHTFNRGRARAEFYIDDGRSITHSNALFRALESQKMQIEQDFGGPLEWHGRPNQRVSRISKSLPMDVDFQNQATWPPCIDQLIATTIHLDKAFRPLLDAVAAKAEAEMAESNITPEDDQSPWIEEADPPYTDEA